MNITHNASELYREGRKFCLAIGFFDGIHLGHQKIIRQAVADARENNATALVVTFDRHPNTVVAPSRVPPLIYSPSQKSREIEALAAGALLVLRFDKDFSEQSGDTFVRGLARDLGRIHSLCVGSHFVFGRKRSGNVALLKELGLGLGFAVHDISPVSLAGKIVSSTRIREAIRSGALELAGQMLGRPYSLAARVVPGDKVGRTLGFPTANLDVTGLALPPVGVYAATALLRNKPHRAVVNIGYRPTLRQPEPSLRVEAHVLDLASDLYSEEIELIFLAKLRNEQKFASLDKLKEQIAIDIERARSNP